MLAQKQQLLVRYYLWATDGPWRLPSRLHYDLMDRKVALPQYAGTKQKVLEVFARRIGVETYSLRGQGTFFVFDENGYLKRVPAEEVMGFIVERARAVASGRLRTLRHAPVKDRSMIARRPDFCRARWNAHDHLFSFISLFRRDQFL